MRCVTVQNLAKLFSQKIELHGGDDCVTSMDGVCDADGVLAAALPSPYLNCPRVSLNFIKLYQGPAKRWLVLVPHGGYGDPTCLLQEVRAAGPLFNVVIDPLYEST